MENLYKILGVSPTATNEEIKKAYRSLAMRYHPDRNQGSHAEIRFNEVQKAYEELSDPKKRAAYDQSLSNRIIVDPESEAHKLWHGLFERCGIALPRDHY